ncbi:hypothetical protein NC652_035763 [Populus alba x Populus x berolinensis]|nr:hypothetical protein NC652_035763 [Populus alba x Populus x berolinensis]
MHAGTIFSLRGRMKKLFCYAARKDSRRPLKLRLLWGNIGGVADETRIGDAAAVDSPKGLLLCLKGIHEESYSFYQEYAKSTAFATSIKNRPQWQVDIHEFVNEHNHELSPALAYHFRIHRNCGGYQNSGFVKSEITRNSEKGGVWLWTRGMPKLCLNILRVSRRRMQTSMQ